MKGDVWFSVLQNMVILSPRRMTKFTFLAELAEINDNWRITEEECFSILNLRQGVQNLKFLPATGAYTWFGGIET